LSGEIEEASEVSIPSSSGIVFRRGDLRRAHGIRLNLCGLNPFFVRDRLPT